LLKKIHHVGIVVRSADDALKFYRDTLGLSVSKDEVVPDQGIRGVLLPVGDSEIELIEPVRDETGVARFLQSRGEGMHHVCFESDDVAAELEGAKAKGLRCIDEKPRLGLAGMIAFLHPAASKGVLVELATPPAGEGDHSGHGIVDNFSHLAVAVKDLDETAKVWTGNYGLRDELRNEVPSLGIKTAHLHVGDAHGYLELTTPSAEGTPVAKFLEERGEGMYSIALDTGNFDQAIQTLQEKDARVGAAQGESPNRIAFVSPRSTNGVLMMLREHV